MPTSARKPKVPIQTLLVLCILLIGMLVTPYVVTATPPNPFAANPVERAWEKVRAAGSYHFSSDVTQTTTPSASVRNVGRRSQTDQIYLEGMADIDATAMEFRLWSGSGSLLQTGSSLAARVADSKTYTKQK